MRVALLQMDIVLGEPEENRRRAEARIRAAAAGGASLVVLPEMWTTGYCLDRIAALADRDLEPTAGLLSSLAKELGIWLVGGSIANRGADGRVRNTALAHGPDGTLLATYEKVHLVPMMNEHLWLAPGDRVVTFSLAGVTAGLSICYDLRFPELFRQMALAGAHLLFVPAEWPSARLHHWRILLQARAVENQCYVIACNRVGRDSDNAFPGHSTVISPWGEVLAEGEAEEATVTATIDVHAVSGIRERVPVFRDRRPDLYRL
jgi:omega-amidase